MNYIIESLLVGIYTCFIYLLIRPFIQNTYLLLLVVGFYKHFLGAILGLWTWYCNNGEACLKVLSQDSVRQKTYKANTLYLIRSSILESIAFLFIGVIFVHKLTNYILFFTVGFILHVISEKLLVHKYFCKSTCDIETN